MNISIGSPHGHTMGRQHKDAIFNLATLFGRDTSMFGRDTSMFGRDTSMY